MSDPRRLSEEGGSDLELSLLRSARHDAPSSASRRKALVALGLAGSVGAAVTATTATSTATTAIVKSSAGALLKWIAVGVIGGVVTVGAVTLVQPSTSGPDGGGSRVPGAAPQASPAAKGLAARAQAEQSKPIETAAPLPAPDPPGEEAAAPRPAASAAPASPRPAPTSLTGEIASLDAAREALAAGDASRALRALDEHDRKFPGGMLGPEATVLRIEALALRGDRASAARLGNAFLDAHPRSPHANRVRTLIGAPAPADPTP